jgi:translation initiation factor IF-2
MPTKSTTTTKAGSRAASGKPRGAAATGSKTAKSAKSDNPEKPTSKPAPEKAAHPAEALSLIDGDEKPPKKAAPRKTFTPISRFGAAKDAAPAQAEKEPEPEPTAEEITPKAEAPVEAPANEENEAKIIHLKPPIIVKDLAAALGLKSFQIIHDLMELNIFASINQSIEPDVAAQVCRKHGFVFEKDRREKGAGVHKPEPVAILPPEPEEIAEEELKPRAPIVTIMGHVDHGKTSLLDTIRKARVAAGEAGGITQHIGAYSVVRDGQSITFLDTPGHAAFTAMRARGASVTDIVVLVVAADDGLMPQTIEAINHAKAAGAPIIVAINKMDLPSANPDKVKKQLQEKGLTPEDWGGDTICCPVSATKGTGVDELLSLIALQAEVMELKATAGGDPRATVIEAEVEPGRGPTATVIVKTGTLKPGQAFITGLFWGKIKQLIGDNGKPVKSAGPATPVKVLGFSGLPKAGDELVVLENERVARALSEERQEALRLEKLSTPQRATLENLFATTDSTQRKELRVVVKADVQGSLEAIVTALEEIPSEKISLSVIHSAVGSISESDVLLASASDAIIIGFGVKVENNASMASKREGVQIKLFSIIYELIDQIKEAMAGLLDPELRESIIGHAEVKQVFHLSKGKVGGCMVTDGRIVRTSRARVLRRRQPIYDGGIATLRRFHDEVKEVRSGLECGIKLGDFNDYEPGDIIECYNLEKVAQTL